MTDLVTNSPAFSLILERDQRLSQSILWQLQRAYFEQQGIEAWRQGAVPYYVTSNAVIAAAYARVVLGFMRDWAAQLDASQPVYIVELGAGTGRFAYSFLKRLSEMLEAGSLRGLAFRYVLTDLPEANRAYWRSHPWLQPFLESGVLDLARFDAERDDSVTLERSGVTLAAGTVCNPVVAIANYMFDGLPSDAFHIEQGELYESLVTLTCSQPGIEVSDPEVLKHVTLSYRHQRAPSAYYGDPHWDSILANYSQELPDTNLLFPCTALSCVRRLEALAGGRLLVLAGDKGYSLDEDLAERDEPKMSIHGSLSLMVNFHALGQYAQARGGYYLRTPHRHANLDICAYVFGRHPGDHAETRLAYAQSIEQGGPDDWFAVKKGLEAHYADLSLDQLLAFVRLSGWDGKILWECSQMLLDQIKRATDSQRVQVYWMLRQVWNAYYPIGEENDLAFRIGMILFVLQYYDEAIEFFQRSAQLYGMDPATACNIAMCYQELRQWQEALAYVNQSLRLYPSYETARTLRVKILAQLQRARQT